MVRLPACVRQEGLLDVPGWSATDAPRIGQGSGRAIALDLKSEEPCGTAADGG